MIILAFLCARFASFKLDRFQIRLIIPPHSSYSNQKVSNSKSFFLPFQLIIKVRGGSDLSLQQLMRRLQLQETIFPFSTANSLIKSLFNKFLPFAIICLCKSATLTLQILQTTIIEEISKCIHSKLLRHSLSHLRPMIQHHIKFPYQLTNA